MPTESGCFRAYFSPGNIRRFDVDLCDLGKRLPCRSVEHNNLPGFGTKDQFRLHRHVEATHHTARHIERYVVGNTTAHDDGGACRSGGEVSA